MLFSTDPESHPESVDTAAGDTVGMETVDGDNDTDTDDEDEDNEGGDEADAMGNDDEVDVTFLGVVSEEKDFVGNTGDDVSDDECDDDDEDGDMLGLLLELLGFRLSRDVLFLFLFLSGDECDAIL